MLPMRGALTAGRLLGPAASRWPALTSDRKLHQPVDAGQSDHRRLTDEHVQHFRRLLGEPAVKTDDLEAFNTDWLKLHQGQSRLALLPSSSEQVSDVLRYCSGERLQVVVQGGNTGLVAGAAPVHDEIVLSLARLNRILSFDELSGVLRAEAGCVLQTLEQHVAERGHQMPLDLGAKGSCQIGGNLATNAGGLRMIRYGSLHGSCLGLEVVLMSGERLDLMSTLRKDNTGYDLKQLFIGSEGTLGVITKCALLCPPRPRAALVGMLSVSSFDRLLEVFRHSRQLLSEQLSAFEMLDRETMHVMQEQLALKAPFDGRFYVLIELAGGEQDDLDRRFAALLELLEERKLLEEGTFSGQPATMLRLWELRERIAEALVKKGYCFKYDLSLPLASFYELVEEMRHRLRDQPAVTSVTGYGHIGDSNLHLTVTCDRYDEALHRQIEPYVYEWVRDRQGSVSAEHGLGLKKNQHAHYSKSESALRLMRQMKHMLDPQLLLNPQKMFTFDADERLTPQQKMH